MEWSEVTKEEGYVNGDSSSGHHDTEQVFLHVLLPGLLVAILSVQDEVCSLGRLCPLGNRLSKSIFEAKIGLFIYVHTSLRNGICVLGCTSLFQIVGANWALYVWLHLLLDYLWLCPSKNTFDEKELVSFVNTWVAFATLHLC